MIVGQWREWQDQVENSLRQNLTPGARQTVAGNLWPGLMSVQSSLQDVLGSVAANFEVLLLPALNQVSNGFKTLARWIDPTTGSPALSMGVLAAGGVGAFLALRGMAGRMGPWSRTLIGGAAGGLLGGGVGEALMGALLGRQLAGNSAAVAGAAGAAGAVAGTAWGARFLGAARWIFRAARSMTLWGVATSAIVGIADNWESVKGRLLGIWEELKRAAPTWAGGHGEGWGALASTGTGIAALPGDLTSYVNSWAQSVQDALMGTEWGRSLFARGWLQTVEQSRQAAIVQRLSSDAALMGIPAAQTQTINIGGIVTHVHVAATNADPNAIGEAAGNAVGNALRNTMGDLPAMP
jgi:hypothetical protein